MRAILDRTFIDRDGTKLSYIDNGGDGTCFVLVHGWCCDHSFFAPQAEHLAKAGHRVVSLDLRGHGTSDAPDVAYTISLFADDVAWCVERLALDKPVIIGHSMGGIVAFDLAARYPDLPDAIVMLDSSVTRSQAARTATGGFCEKLAGPDRINVMRDYVSTTLFIPTDDSARKELLLKRMSSTSAHVVVSAMEGLRDYDPSYAAGLIKAASLYIAADEPVARSDLGALRDLIPQLLFGQTVGSGHFCQLEVPDQVNAMLDRFMQIKSKM